MPAPPFSEGDEKVRKLKMDICDYYGNAVCNLYDNEASIAGQAADVHIRTERNGWKELSFSLPSVYGTDEGMVRNHRLDYLIADWRIRVTDDYETDWYIISEPRITHNHTGTEVEVTAGHVAQLLKTKNLGLEFSDDEGNNIGTALDLLTTILDGTGWEPGNVAMFMEDDNFDVEKQRSLIVSSKTGAFKMITDLCEIFSAKAVFHGGTKTVDLLPMNPFSHVIAQDQQTGRMKCGRIIDLAENEIPTWAETCPVLELHYDKYLKGITRTINTENVSTKLTAYGSKDDTTLGMCSLQNAEHTVYTFLLDQSAAAGDIIRITVDEENKYFRAKTALAAGATLEWSTLDTLSMSYLWDGLTAHRVLYSVPKDVNPIPTTPASKTTEQNWYQYLFDFSHYDKAGLVTDEMIQHAADFQHTAWPLIKTSYEKSLAFSDAQTKLSEIGESNAGFLKLAVNSWREASNGGIRLNIDHSKGKENDGVLYRSDYDEQARKYFTWHVAERLKEDGTSLDNIGSVIYAIKRRENMPPIWRMFYVRSVDDRKETRTDIYGKEVEKYADYVYATQKERPGYVTLWGEYGDFESAFGSYSASNKVEFFLLCANSMTGMLGALQSGDESILETLNNSTKVVTDPHPVVFVEQGKTMPNARAVSNTYAWCYEYDPNSEGALGELYFFCSGYSAGWEKVDIVEQINPDAATTAGYLFDTRAKMLYRRDSGTWVKMDSSEEKTMAQGFTKVIYYCRKRDRMYKGIHEKYIYDIPAGGSLAAGNYAIKSDFHFCWVFTTEGIDASVIGIESIDLTEVAFTESDGVYTSAHIPLTPGAWYNYTFNSEYRVRRYDSNDQLIESIYLDGDGCFQIGSSTAYLVLSRDKLPEDGETIIHKDNCQLWLDTNTNSVYQEDDISRVVEAQSKSYDTVEFPPANLLTDDVFTNGTLDETGKDAASTTHERSQNIDVYPGVTYRYEFTDSAIIVLYDAAKYKTRVLPVVGQGTFTTNPNEEYMKVATTKPPTNRTGWVRDVHVDDYMNKVFVNNTLYTFLNTRPDGERKGINNLMSMFVDAADEAYIDCLADLLTAQQLVREKEQEMADIFGDMYREGWWETEEYVRGDEQKLYVDALRNLKVAARPETTYDIDFQDLYGTEDDDSEIDYPDITMEYAIHMIDPEIDVNLWGYIDDLDKCYDQPWETEIKVNTLLSDVAQHGFGDVMSYIADVTKVTHANQSVYARAANFSSDGFLSANKLEGIISATANKLSGGSSNWYTDPNGNLVIESQDGLNAMMLTGMGFMVANSKNKDSEWNWRSFGTGEGFTADEINGGTINGLLIRAKSISAEAVMSNFGQQLDIASNRALLLYATVDGVQPAGGLETAHPGTNDSFIYIKGGDECTEEFYLSEQEYSLSSGVYTIGPITVTPNAWYNYHFLSEYTVQKYNADDELIESVKLDGDGRFQAYNTAYIKLLRSTLPSAAEYIAGNYVPARIDIASGGDVNLYSGSTMNIDAESGIHIRTGGTFTVDSAKFSIDEDGNVSMEGKVTATSGAIAGFIIERKTVAGKDISRIYHGTATFDSTAKGVYIGTDGISVGGGNFKADADGYVYVYGQIEATTGLIGGWNISQYHIGNAETYAASTVGVSSYGAGAGYAFYAGKSRSIIDGSVVESVMFGVTSDGKLTAKEGRIANWYFTTSHIGNASTATNSTCGIGTSNTGNVFWAGGTGNSGNFYVTNTGILHASGATISGNITADTGTIAGFTISYETETSGGQTTIKRRYMYAGYCTTVTSPNSGVYIGTDGINANLGKIGGWYISTTHIGNASTEADSTVGLKRIATTAATADYVFWAGSSTKASAPFYVKSDGTMHASKADISGEITAKYVQAGASITSPLINGGSITGSTINIGEYTYTSSGVTYTTYGFAVSSYGTLTVRSYDQSMTSSIMQWSIGPTAITSQTKNSQACSIRYIDNSGWNMSAQRMVADQVSLGSSTLYSYLELGSGNGHVSGTGSTYIQVPTIRTTTKNVRVAIPGTSPTQYTTETQSSTMEPTKISAYAIQLKGYYPEINGWYIVDGGAGGIASKDGSFWLRKQNGKWYVNNTEIGTNA